jgi:hypothetical protein
VPALFDQKSYRRSLKRWEAPGDHAPTFEMRGEAADSPDRRTGYVGGVNVMGATSDTVKVEVEFSGTGPDGKRVDVSRTFSLPWLGQFDGDFDGIGRIHAAFERVPPNR